MQVRYDEGLATHIGPEPCGVIREGGGEASAGERIGQPSSPENHDVPDADAVDCVEGDTFERASASASRIRRGRRPWHVRKLLVREPGGLVFGLREDAAGPHREGEEP